MNENQQAAFIMAQATCALIRMEGMKAENQIQQMRNEYPKYVEDDFRGLLAEYKIEWNDVLGYFNR